MRRLGLLALIVVVGGGFYLIRDPGHIPLFDAGLKRLAESELEGYCAGTTFWKHNGQPDAADAAECRSQSTYNSTIDIARVTPAFCRGVSDSGYAGGVGACIGILTSGKLWPTFEGGLTDAWSKTAPYPGDLAFVIPADDSRTGERDGFSRDDSTTTTEPTTTTGEE